MSGQGKCGKLQRHFYGTRGAAAGWESNYVQFMLNNGFVRGIASGCLFTHPERDIQCAIYGDDFTLTGTTRELDWFEAELHKRDAVTLRGRLGAGSEDDKEATLLNRVIRWIDGVGLEFEADPHQAEMMISQLGFEGANLVSTPGIKLAITDIENDISIVDGRATIYRAVTARANVMANDRPETQFATKETCRSMASPTEESHNALKRLGRFIAGKPRFVISYPSSGSSMSTYIVTLIGPGAHAPERAQVVVVYSWEYT